MLLRIDEMKVRYGDYVALYIDKPITIEEGDRIGVIGSNGAGKSTLIRSLLGLKRYEGHVETELTLRDMAVHMQFNEYTDSMACRHVMERVLRTKIEKSPKLLELIEYFDFGSCLSKKYQKLSGGQKQRFTLIMVMMQEAPLTFYDEVTSGLDFETRQRLMEKLSRWYESRQGALVVVSHYYEELERLTDKLLILDQGKVIAFDRRDRLFQTFCGRIAVVMEDTRRNRELIKGCRQLAAPEHYLAVSCEKEEQETALLSRLARADVNFRRSNCDTELLYINAMKASTREHPKRRYLWRH